MKVIERFLGYVKYNTQSDPHSNTLPSTSGQIVFAKVLAEEMKRIGLQDVNLNANGYLMGFLPANTTKEIPAIGFIAHMDTSPDMSGENVEPTVVEKYSGNDIVLNKKNNIILSPEISPELSNYVGQDLVVTNGMTLLGADDKAGIAEILTAIEYLIQHPEIHHGKVCVCFTPDEEIGEGSKHLDIKAFGATYAFTVDGGGIGELEIENFNAAIAKIVFKGRNFHPGYAKNKMVNSIIVAYEFLSMLPKKEVPEMTAGYDGFFHLHYIKGNVEQTEIEILIRDFDKDGFKHRKEVIENGVREFSKKYQISIDLDLKDQYYNMREKIEPVSYIVDIANQAMVNEGIKPIVQPIRGGTDGANLSFMGLPTPNIFTGAHNIHGKYEYIPVQSMEKAVRTIVGIVELFGSERKK
ncbi:MAG: peptidase T [Culturomica sp.]|nr:peptidase T [Culturomica sp.]